MNLNFTGSDYSIIKIMYNLLQGIRANCRLLRHLDQTDSAQFRTRFLCVLCGAKMVEAI